MHGSYRRIRHPFYISYLLYWVAGMSSVQRWELLLTVMVMGALYWKAVLEEERTFLQSEQRYARRQYMACTGRLVPRFFSNYRQGRRAGT